jgi:hypothetical protein
VSKVADSGQWLKNVLEGARLEVEKLPKWMQQERVAAMEADPDLCEPLERKGAEFLVRNGAAGVGWLLEDRDRLISALTKLQKDFQSLANDCGREIDRHCDRIRKLEGRDI